MMNPNLCGHEDLVIDFWPAEYFPSVACLTCERHLEYCDWNKYHICATLWNKLCEKDKKCVPEPNDQGQCVFCGKPYDPSVYEDSWLEL